MNPLERNDPQYSREASGKFKANLEAFDFDLYLIFFKNDAISEAFL